SCHGSGFIFKNAAIRWYRHEAGGKFKWVSYISSGQGTTQTFAEEVQNRATVSRDNSQSKSFLELRDLHPQDSAQYFCAV
ncbi:HV158 protein, partial [Heliornis fulica]|nr:HV158 protein [Heliornis fulica]